MLADGQAVTLAVSELAVRGSARHVVSGELPCPASGKRHEGMQGTAREQHTSRQRTASDMMTTGRSASGITAASRVLAADGMPCSMPSGVMPAGSSARRDCVRSMDIHDYTARQRHQAVS